MDLRTLVGPRRILTTYLTLKVKGSRIGDASVFCHWTECYFTPEGNRATGQI